MVDKEKEDIQEHEPHENGHYYLIIRDELADYTL
jgi:hypothetical protein